MTKPLQLAVVALALCGAVAAWHFYRHSSRAEVAVAERPPAGNAVGHGVEPKTVSAADVLRARCGRDGIAMDSVSTRKKEPQVPESFAAETKGDWSKIIRKLEARHGFVPVYDRADPELKNVPAQITQVGPYLYFGRDSGEIRALKMLADGDADARSAAMNLLADDSKSAEPLLLALLKSDSDPQIRIEAAQKLQSLPSERSISALLEALGDSDEAVQSAARTALVWIGDEQVLKAVRVATNSPNKKIADMAASILERNLERR